MTVKHLPPAVAPMLAKTGQLPPDAEAYGFEIKWDGIRALCYLARGRIRLLSRNLKDITFQYPDFSALATALPERALILDGEIVALGPDGKPSFSLLQHRMGLSSGQAIRKLRGEIPATYIIFDILHLDGRPLFSLPYTERRRILESLHLAGPAWQTPAYTSGQGRAILDASREIGLEGIIAKRLDSPYQPGKRPGTWIKIKNSRRQELVIAGWVPGKGRRSGRIGAILLGYYDPPPQGGLTSPLRYAGKAGTGFTAKTLDDLAKRFAPLQIGHSPFAGQPPVKDAIYLQPTLVGEFEFTEWTPAGTLRHPSFKGLRSDKAAQEVVREPN